MAWSFHDPEPADPLIGASFRTMRVGHVGTIQNSLGAGGQGAVYNAKLNGVEVAIKWYHPSYAAIDQNLRPRLSRAIDRGAPNAAFLWPLDFVEIPGQASFGYLMRLRDSDYVGMRSLISRPPARVEPPLSVRAAICLHIAQNFLELHASGFCYQDINFGNIFFHASSGEILICDNDNVDFDGAQASVYGTRKFMAPEIVRGEATPSTKSDLFSMAVLFFYVLHAWHPLDGKKEAAIDIMEAAAEMDLYGTHPVFLFDPNDSSNGPLKGMHEPIEARWKALPAAVRNLFIRAFTIGLVQPNSRVQEAEWRAAFAAFANATFACSGCGFEHTVEAVPHLGPQVPPVCLSCGRPLQCPPVLALERNAVCLQLGSQVPAYALNPRRSPDFSVIAAKVEQHPTKPWILGLRNLSTEPWRVHVKDSSSVSIPPGNTMRLLHLAIVEFGSAVGTIFMPEPGANGGEA